MNLNDRSVVTEKDPTNLLKLVEDFPEQCRRALEIALAVELPSLESRPSMVVLTGMGGSAAGGDFVRAIFEAQGSAPFVVNRDYHLPHYVGLGDVVFCASFSGNTEETLSAYADARKAGAKIICVTSGGKLKELAEENNDGLYIVPGGQPPRTALGLMLIPVLLACEKLKLIHEQDYDGVFAALESVKAKYRVEVPDNDAKILAEELNGNFPVIYGLGTWQGLIAGRWKGQINENAKCLALVNSFPELNHNEILGFVNAHRQGGGKFVGILLEDGEESEKMQARFRVSAELASKAIKFHRIKAEGNSLLAKLLSLAYHGDWVSMYLARLNDTDPENIDWLNTLKAELAKIS